MSAMFCFASIPKILAFLRGNQQTSYGTVIFEMQVMQVIGKRRHLLKKISGVFFFHPAFTSEGWHLIPPLTPNEESSKQN